MSAFPLPEVTPADEHFWAGPPLRLLRCRACRRWIHPPGPVCPDCLGRDLAPEPVSGRGRVFSFTVNHRVWGEGVEAPYVVAIVELEEGPRLTTNVVGCAPEEVRIGMGVRVRFAERDGVHLPLFEPGPEDA